MTTATARQVLAGLGVGRGCVVAPVAVLRPAPTAPADEPAAPDVEVAAATVEQILAGLADELRASADSSDGALREVLAATAAIAADPALLAEIRRRLESGAGPAGAVASAVESFAAMFTDAGGYLAERVTDLHSVRDRVVASLLGVPGPGLPVLERPTVVVAVDLSPADTAALDLSKVAAIVTEEGGPTGHTAIIAGQLGLPCLVRVPGVTSLLDGTVVAVDAVAGTVTVDPSGELRDRFAARAEQEQRLATDTRPGATIDGREVALLANIGTPADARRAASVPAEGVGLFRTEVLFLGRRTAPTVAEQAQVYREVLAASPSRKVVIRTLDAGADKPLDFATQHTEENPALGVRGYRLTRTLPEIVQTQFEALGIVAAELAAADRDRLWVMAPMVATAAEARDVARRGRAAGLPSVGVMVEVPAAALRARQILAEVDFVSLGTNDLAQYTMAADRLRGELADLLDPWQPAVLDLVATTARAGVEAGKPVGVCGESASDPYMALVLTGLGVTSLSMAPTALPAVRYALRQYTWEQCQSLAGAALAADDAASARAAVVALVGPEVGEVLGG